jgi:uncharacterized membrane protein YhaH (DUF805 family)
MGFGTAIQAFWQNYANFKGRSSRSEYWWWTLFTIIVTTALSGVSDLDAVASIAFFLPSIAVGARRMHDVGHNGWWQLFPIYNIVLACRQSSSEMNKYGPPPPPTL